MSRPFGSMTRSRVRVVFGALAEVFVQSKHAKLGCVSGFYVQTFTERGKRCFDLIEARVVPK
jgi:hypothetical protein